MRQLENDRYQFVARHKDLIVRAGSNVSPMIEVERILLLHPCVIDATVLGVPDTKLGQRIVGFVHLTDDAGVALLDNILRFAFGRLADYKVPDQIYSLPLIPRNALGKIDRTALLKSI
ncbi:MAG: class I adenylate-forming enzyme family protein [Pseudomonadota bacterium]|uniref:class I adenylate-forming enzyme family protein n=2 Tax=Burkholderiales TaxID=80840 RepID=UPI0032C45F54